MKTIEVTDEMYDKLMELSNLMNTQNHRSTAMPYFFQIRTNERISVAEGCGTEAWCYDGSIIESDEEVIDTIFEYLGEKQSKDEIKKLPDYRKDEVMEQAGWRKIWYDHKHEYQNAFLTEKACKEHIRLNSYHYTEPADYLQHAFRNPELELVSEFICGLTGGKPHK